MESKEELIDDNNNFSLLTLLPTYIYYDTKDLAVAIIIKISWIDLVLYGTSVVLVNQNQYQNPLVLPNLS